MRTADFTYDLPEALIAQRPVPQRTGSRLLVMERQTGQCRHEEFPALLNYLRAGDVLVLNDTWVIRARLCGVNRKSGGEFEALLVAENGRNDWWAMVRPGRRARAGTEIVIHDAQGAPTEVRATVTDKNAQGQYRLRFTGTPNIVAALERLGAVPLPPYIRRAPGEDLRGDVERYQTVYGRVPGSVAAPTAGLHFTAALLEQIRRRGVEVCAVTLHVGPGTFTPVKTEVVADHMMHEERYAIEESTAARINAAKAGGRRVVAVGTTSVRVLEAVAATHGGRIVAGAGHTRLFIYPSFQFQVVDVLLTNFHLPRSTLLMLVSAFAAPGGSGGREMVLSAYAEAARAGYRFYSYGDAMLLI